MHFKRRIKNRRLERRHVLEVKMRTSQRRKMRALNAIWIILLVVLTTVSVYVAREGFLAFCDWAFIRNPYFNIRHLPIETDGVIKREQIQSWAGVRPGLNLFALDLVRVRRDLELISVIGSAEVERVLPDTLKIRIREREPVARFRFPQLRIPGASTSGFYTLDAEGLFMLPLEPHQCVSPEKASIEDLPALVEIPLADLRPGYHVESPQVQLALQLIAAFQRSPMAGLAVLEEINLKQLGLLQVRTRDGVHITFGASDLDRQLRRWRTIHDYARSLGKQLEALDLSIIKNVPLVWRAPAPNPVPEIQNPKNSAVGKKNV
jgi:cell division septal protein FtsQ